MTSHLSQWELTLRSRQLNPYDHLFWKSRGYLCRPKNFMDILEEMGWFNRHDNEDEEEYYEEEDEYYEEEDEYYEEEDDEYEEEDDEYYEEDDEYDEEEDYDEEYEEQIRQKSLENNPNNVAYWRLRGYRERPENWRELAFGY